MKAFIAKTRHRIAATAVQRFETEPGRQAQVDWKEFEKLAVDGRETRLYVFVIVLATPGGPSSGSRRTCASRHSLPATSSPSPISAACRKRSCTTICGLPSNPIRKDNGDPRNDLPR